MNPRIQRAIWGFAILGAAATALAGGAHIGKQRRLATYYLSFRNALERALGHYEGSMYVAARTGINREKILRVLERPPVPLNDQQELHCDVIASVRCDVDPCNMYVTILGPPEVVTYLYSRLLADSELAVGTDRDLCVDGKDASVTVKINVFDAGNPLVLAIAAQLKN